MRRSKQEVPLRPYPRGHFPTFGTAASSPTIPATKRTSRPAQSGANVTMARSLIQRIGQN